MNTLSKNRILEAGDEYKDKDGTWKPVPKAHLGLQVMFSPCQECRRPSEPAVQHFSEPISPDRDAAADNRESSRRETPAHSVEANPAKAESDKTPVPSHSGTGDHSPEGPLGGGGALVSTSQEIRFPAIRSQPVWTGRNGTFDCKALNLRRENDVIQIIPKGKRGWGNCLIECPVAVIPEIVDWLTRQWAATTK
jgi:hypothetical protein